MKVFRQVVMECANGTLMRVEKAGQLTAASALPASATLALVDRREAS
jgi:hypothetical protein